MMLPESEDSVRDLRTFAQATLDAVREPMLVMDTNLCVLSANAAFYEAFQVTPAETVARLVYRLGNGQWDIPQLRELLGADLPENGALDGCEITHDFAILGRRTLVLNLRRVEALEVILLTIDDVTAERRAHKTLTEAEERFRTLFETIDEGWCVIELIFDENETAVDYRFLEVNPAFERHTGLHDAVGRRMREMVPEHEEHWFRTYGRVALSGEPVRFEERAQAMGRWFDVYAFRLQRPQERKVAVLFSDITLRKEAELSLRESEERFRLMADSAPVMVRVTEADGSCTYLNAAWYEFTGQAFESSLGFGWLAAVHSEDRETTRARLQDTVAGRRPLRMEYRLRSRDGAYHWAIDASAPRFADTGEFLGYIGSILDITERHKLEDDLRYAMAVKDEFLSLVSHELRTPLTVIRGNASLLTRVQDLKPETRTQLLEDVVAEAERLNRIIENMLVLGRLEAGKALASQPVLLARTIRRAVATVEEERPEMEIVATTPENLVAFGVEEYIEQVLQNLLSNAQKYSGPRTSIEVWTRREGRFIEISIGDRGAGIREPEKLFTPFYRENRTSEYAVGLGLGLAVCKRLVEVQGGHIRAEPRPGGGSVFTFTLPVPDPEGVPAKTHPDGPRAAQS